MTDLLLDRLTVPSGQAGQLPPIPFPAGSTPAPARDFSPPAGAPMPKADIAVITYTTAESEALADVLTPGVHHTAWVPYTKGWAEFEKQLTGRSPAAFAKCAAHYWPTTIAGVTVLAIKSELHLSTDSPSLPVAQLVKQIVADTGCKLVITTGTAGGVGATEVLADVVIADAVKANMAKSPFVSEPWAQQLFPCTYQPTTAAAGAIHRALTELIPAQVLERLKASGYGSRTPEAIYGKHCETVGYFAFADTADSYGVVKNDPDAGIEEMDDAAVAVALAALEDRPLFVSIRNVSDPQMGGGSLQHQKRQAEDIYQADGYDTTVCSALVVWAVAATWN